jgi:hypothetical protein
MKLDLNRPFITQDVADLLASKDDSHNRQMRVDLRGFAFLSDVVGKADLEDVAFRLETWGSGNGYTGPKAAANLRFVKRVEKVLRDNWPNPSMSYIEIF